MAGWWVTSEGEQSHAQPDTHYDTHALTPTLDPPPNTPSDTHPTRPQTSSDPPCHPRHTHTHTSHITAHSTPNPQDHIQEENRRLEEDGQFWAKEIVVRIEYKFCPNLTIIDTPGGCRGAGGGKCLLFGWRCRRWWCAETGCRSVGSGLARRGDAAHLVCVECVLVYVCARACVCVGVVVFVACSRSGQPRQQSRAHAPACGLSLPPLVAGSSVASRPAARTCGPQGCSCTRSGAAMRLNTNLDRARMRWRCRQA
jgi:hypothetical protein